MEGQPSAPRIETEVQVEQSEGPKNICGWRLHLTIAGLGLCLFLVELETTIVGTALMSMANDLNDFSKSGWVISGYLITYTGGLIFWPKLKDLLGRKWTFITALSIFALFSGACGGSNTMIQLIMFRVIQGFGSSGTYTLATAVKYELVPPSENTIYASLIMILYKLPLAFGPMLGGLVSELSTWRWVFALNLPLGVLIAITLSISIPKDFPHQDCSSQPRRLGLSAIDFGRALLMLSATTLLVAGLQEAASLLDWKSNRVRAPLCASGLAWVLFFISQWAASHEEDEIEPVFSWRFLQSRVITGFLLNSFMTGAVSTGFMIQLPILYQAVAALNPFQAGLRLIPFVAASFVAGIMVPKVFSPIYVVIFGSLYMCGLSYTSASPPNNLDWNGLYGYQVLIGVGVGSCMGAADLLTPFLVGGRDLGVRTGAAVQSRLVGGAVALSITTAAGNNRIKESLSDYLTTEQLKMIFRSTATIATLPDNLEHTVRETFARSFDLQMGILEMFAIAALCSAFLMWQRPQITLS
ncbi:putative multidrug resistance protein fnx1 [Annulohypoxylon nitens]|nr:putative multidrug resistance protein fnx1 [Annulohypoxylon nitens]